MTELRALLLTDVVDSTQWSQQVGDAEMARLWALHDRAARDLLPHWNGREIDKSDGLFLLFDNADDAAGYALDYHRALQQQGLPFQARAGLHLGPVSLRENSAADIALGAKALEVDGLAKPVVARTMSVALGGQTLITDDARLALGSTTQRLLSHGHWRLRGVAEPVELFEIGDEHSPFSPPADQAKAYRVLRQGQLWLPVREVRHSLPAERDGFVGRDDALGALARKLEAGARLVSVLGIGGTGKTRLVTHFAWQWLGDYPGGVWFCDLSQARGLEGILVAMAQGLGLALGRSDAEVQLVNAIAGRGRCLLVIDNFEQVARLAEATLGQWLDRAPQASFIVTTREVLGIQGEETMALAPLGNSDAARLFHQRALAAWQGYTPSADDLAAVDQLVQVLDGLPLAIELAAARVRVMSPKVLLSRMNERFKLLWSRGGRQDRQATLRATFDWSWELLGEAERMALAQLSVFRGGFTLATAEAVLDLAELDDPPWAADLVLWLVEKSLVRQLANERFDLLESVRDYADEHLRTPGRFNGSGEQALAATMQRHAACFSTLADLGGAEPDPRELDNLVAACRHGVALGDAPLASGSLLGAWRVLRLRGPYRIGLALADAAAAMPDLVGGHRVLVDFVRGSALELCGSAAEAQQALLQVEASATEPDHRHLKLRAQHRLVALMARQGQLEESTRRCAGLLTALEGLGGLEGLGQPDLACGSLNSVASVCEAHGQYDEAGRHYERALQLAQDSGQRRWEGGSAGNLAAFHANQGRLAQARPLYELATQIALELGDRQFEANNRSNLGLMHFLEGQVDLARSEFERVLPAAREMGYVRLAATVHCNLGLVTDAQGLTELAQDHQQNALTLAREVNDQRLQGQVLGYLGLLHSRQSRLDAARSCLAEGEALLLSAGDQASLGILLCGRVEIEVAAGQTAIAEQALQQARALALALPGMLPESEFGQALAKALALTGVLS